MKTTSQTIGLTLFQFVYIRKKFNLAKKLVFCQLLMPPEPKTHLTIKTNRTELWKTKWRNLTQTATKKSCAGEEGNSENLEITQGVDFLMGAASQLRRSVRLNSRFVFKVKPEPGNQLLLLWSWLPISLLLAGERQSWVTPVAYKEIAWSQGLDLQPSTFRSEFQSVNLYINASQSFITKGQHF